MDIAWMRKFWENEFLLKYGADKFHEPDWAWEIIRGGWGDGHVSRLQEGVSWVHVDAWNQQACLLFLFGCGRWYWCDDEEVGDPVEDVPSSSSGKLKSAGGNARLKEIRLGARMVSVGFLFFVFLNRWLGCIFNLYAVAPAGLLSWIISVFLDNYNIYLYYYCIAYFVYTCYYIFI